jgi:hypothetical protein
METKCNGPGVVRHLALAMRCPLIPLFLILSMSALAQQRDRFTLYDAYSEKPRRIKEGKQITLSLIPDRCVGWEERNQSISGTLLLVEDSTVTVLYNGEDLWCSQGDSTFTWNNWDVDQGTSRTVPNSRIYWVEKAPPVLGSVFTGIMGAAFMTTIFVAPLASINWFNGWDFNADTYTSITRAGLIGIGASIPLAAAFSGSDRLVPKGHAIR